jgi:hypothetical protein
MQNGDAATNSPLNRVFAGTGAHPPAGSLPLQPFRKVSICSLTTRFSRKSTSGMLLNRPVPRLRGDHEMGSGADLEALRQPSEISVYNRETPEAKCGDGLCLSRALLAGT